MLHVRSMSKMIQIRDVPDDVHKVLKMRAAREGMTLSDYIKRELAHSVAKPTMEEWLERVRQAKPIVGAATSVEAVRALRNSR
jgi:plasmid stability protein